MRVCTVLYRWWYVEYFVSTSFDKKYLRDTLATLTWGTIRAGLRRTDASVKIALELIDCTMVKFKLHWLRKSECT
jgi:hypothetical protein